MTHRAATIVSLLLLVGVSTIALCIGVAVGVHWAERKVTDHRSLDAVEWSYVADELGTLSASIGLIEPRIARLAKSVCEMTNAQTRVRIPMGELQKHSWCLNADDGSRHGVEELALSPQRGIAPVAVKPDVGIVAIRGQIERLDRVLMSLEREAILHAVAWVSLPGRRPVDSARLSSSFGHRVDPFNRRSSFHPGIDLVAPTGTPILAAAGGRVTFSGWKSGYGKVVDIDHGNLLVTRYGHASRLRVREGDLVLPREHIADVGSTGRSTGPHLHFEVLDNGVHVDPAAYLVLFQGDARG